MKLAKYVKFRQEKFGGVLFETRSEQVFTLNETAASIIKALEQFGDEVDIVARLEDEYRGANGSVRQDTEALIAELRDKGLIED